MTASEIAPGRRLEPSARGVIVLVAAVVVGLVLLAKAEPGRVGSARVTANAANTATSAVTQPSTTTPVTSPPPSAIPPSAIPPSTTVGPAPTTPPALAPGAHAPTQVKVVVLNGSAGLKGVASSGTDKVKAKGYDALPAGNAPAQPTTVVFYAAGYQADALLVAQAIGPLRLQLQPLPSPPPTGAGQANVAVVLGQDTPAAR